MLHGEDNSSPRNILALTVAGKCHTISDFADDIRALWAEFSKLERDETILGCRTRTQFCHVHMSCTMRAVQLTLADKKPSGKVNARLEVITEKEYDQRGDFIVKPRNISTSNEEIRSNAVHDLLVDIIAAKNKPKKLATAIDAAEHFPRYGVDAEHRI